MQIEKNVFGQAKDGSTVYTFTLQNKNGMKVNVLNYGGIIQSVYLPDREGNLTDVVLGYEDMKGYMNNTTYFGAIIGRNANRVKNACFTIDGTTYQLEKNEGDNNLHSNVAFGYHNRIWHAKANEEKNAVELTLNSPDGDCGFPGNAVVTVTYILTEDNALELHYHAVSDKKTVFNMTNHSYFNLAGHNAGSILDHKVWIKSNSFTPVEEGGVPTGEILPVKGTPMDFTTERKVGDDIDADYEQLRLAGGYDHNWMIEKESDGVELIATVKEPESKRTMEVYTDAVGVQFYAGNFIVIDQDGKEHTRYEKRTGLCLETQFVPNSMNEPNFKSPVFDSGVAYETTTIYKFI